MPQVEGLTEGQREKQAVRRLNDKLTKMCKGMYEDLAKQSLCQLQSEWASCQAR